MSKLKISYFDVNGGRAEPIRLAFHFGDITFDDHRFPFANFEHERKQTPLSQVPTLTIDNVQITQSSAILRYAGKLANLYPIDNYQALLCDEIIDAAEDCIDKIVATFPLTGDEQKAARITLSKGDLTKYLKFLENKLIQNGGEYFAGNTLTIADLKLPSLISWLNSGTLDHISTTLVAEVAPKLNQHVDKVLTHPKIAAYYANNS